MTLQSVFKTDFVFTIMLCNGDCNPINHSTLHCTGKPDLLMLSWLSCRYRDLEQTQVNKITCLSVYFFLN